MPRDRLPRTNVARHSALLFEAAGNDTNPAAQPVPSASQRSAAATRSAAREVLVPTAVRCSNVWERRGMCSPSRGSGCCPAPTGPRSHRATSYAISDSAGLRPVRALAPAERTMASDGLQDPARVRTSLERISHFENSAPSTPARSPASAQPVTRWGTSRSHGHPAAVGLGTLLAVTPYRPLAGGAQPTKSCGRMRSAAAAGQLVSVATARRGAIATHGSARWRGPARTTWMSWMRRSVKPASQ